MKRFKALKKENSILNRKYLYLILFDLKALLNHFKYKKFIITNLTRIKFFKISIKKIQNEIDLTF